MAGDLAMPIANITSPIVRPTPATFPTVAAAHTHARELLENALRYLGPATGIIDVHSSYPVEGWNHEPAKGLYLRSFTQLTAIGQWLEILAEVVAGRAGTPAIGRDAALAHLSRAVKSLRDDQRDRRVAARGLLGNFLDLSTGRRLGPLTTAVDHRKFHEVFGREQGDAIWKALAANKWLTPFENDSAAHVRRGPRYGWNFFQGPLEPYRDDPTRQKIMAILDERILLVVFGDNANLSCSAAKTIGTLLLPHVKDQPGVAPIREGLEDFLDEQQAGYAHLYDTQAAMFSFGWDATRDRMLGWQDLEGNWHRGHLDYLVNEFRGPATFVVLRFGLPMQAIANLGFTLKPYQLRDGQEVHALAPWEGSAFQALGLALSMMELNHPVSQQLLRTFVDVELDYAERHGLPGFLSESYTGRGTQYTGDVGIPEMAVNSGPRITTVASLYTLGAAYSVAPREIERFLASRWTTIARLMTDHGPWEGFDVAAQEPIRVQTSAHTFSLILGLLATGSENMERYLESRGCRRCLETVYPVGDPADLLARQTNVFAWADNPKALQARREAASFHVAAAPIRRLGIAFVSSRPTGVNLAGEKLRLRYRSAQALPVKFAFKAPGQAPAGVHRIGKEFVAQLADTGAADRELEVLLPATPGLTQIKEVVLTWEAARPQPVQLTIDQFAFSRP
jgi:hypothetical protein